MERRQGEDGVAAGRAKNIRSSLDKLDLNKVYVGQTTH